MLEAKEREGGRIDEEILGAMVRVKLLVEERDEGSEAWDQLWKELAGEWFLEGRVLREKNGKGENWVGEYRKDFAGEVEVNKIDVEKTGENLNYAHIFLVKEKDGGETLGAIIEAKIRDQILSFDSF